MKKLLFSFFLIIFSTHITHAGGISRPTIESITNPTINGFTVSAFSVPAYTGNRDWSILFSEAEQNPARWFEIKNIPAVTGRGSTVPAPKNCTESSDLDCPIRIESYSLQASQIQCGKRYNVVFRVISLDQPNTQANSRIVTVNTPNCSQTGVLGVQANLTQKDDSTMTLTVRANISGFSGEQEAEFFLGIKEGDSQDVEITEYQSLGKKSGLSSIDFTADIPNLDCEKKYVYKTKVKIGAVETFTPSGTGVYRTGNTFECSTSLGTGENEDETEGDNRYVFLTPLPFNEGLNPQESVIIGATGEEGILGILQRIFTLMLVAAVVLAVVFLIIGGARYATGDTLGGVQGGRQIITNAVTGLLFALLAWLLLNVINPDLLRFTLVIPNVGSKLTPGTGNPDGGSGGDSPCAGLSDEECFEQIVADEDSKRGELRAAGIEVNKEPCSNYGESNCTHVGLLNESTLAKLIEVKNDCVSANRSCTVMVTGGTEYWLHSEGGSHRDFIAVDLRLTGADVFNQFIRSKQSVGSNEYCNARFDYKGLRFCDEKGGTPHWHVAPTSGGGGSGNTGNPRLFTFPHINIQGYVVPNTGEVYSGAQLTSKLEAPAMRALESKIRTVATREGIDFKLFYSLIAQESAGNPQATSPKGACGVTQLKPSSASEVDPTLTGDICTKLKNDVDLSISLGAKYFKKYGSTPKDKLAHYNGGNQALESSVDCPGRKKYECPWNAPGYYDRNNPSGPPLKTLEKQSDINVGFSETRFYVINILNMAAAMRTQ